MAQVLIRNVDARTVEVLKARARANGRSLEADLRLLLEREVERVGGSTVGGLAARYIVKRAAPLSDTHREDPPGSGIWVPKKRGRFRDVTPIKVKGQPASEIIIEDRRNVIMVTADEDLADAARDAMFTVVDPTDPGSP